MMMRQRKDVRAFRAFWSPGMADRQLLVLQSLVWAVAAGSLWKESLPAAAPMWRRGLALLLKVVRTLRTRKRKKLETRRGTQSRLIQLLADGVPCLKTPS